MIEIPTTGPELQAFRESINIDQKALAERLDCSPAKVSLFETGTRNFPEEFLMRYRRTLAAMADEQARKSRAVAEVLA
jgi:predicted transcriptional regulator